MILDTKLLLTFKKLPLFEFCNRIKEEYPQTKENLIKYSSLFQLYIYVKPYFISDIATKVAYHNSLSVEADTRICHLLSQTLKRFPKPCNNERLLKVCFGK